jgi:UDP-2,4-diacetamido-2,4,6-trideoxy-beta-L-altropyranose hydrolase
LPMITIKTAKNQNQMHKYLKKKGYFTMKKFDKRLLEKSIIKLLGD